MSRLTIFRDDAFLEEHVLMRAIVALGRHPENDIVLDDRTLSRFHARLERRGDRYVVIDLGAQNGVYLNGTRITGEHDLVPGDRIGVGRYVAIFDQENASRSRRRADKRPSAEAPAARSGLEASKRAPTDAAPTLALLYNGLEVSRHPVLPGKALTVGRSKTCDIVIGLLGLSRRHAEINLSGDVPVVRDLGSQNGTWVNNVRIEGEHRLRPGDLLNFYEYGIQLLAEPDEGLGQGGGAGPFSLEEALDLGEGSYLGEAFDAPSDELFSSLAGEEPLDDGTDVLRAYAAVDASSEARDGSTAPYRGAPDDFLSESQTSTVRAKHGSAPARWPSDVELEDALSQPSSERLASVEVYLGARLFTQVPLANPVTRIGADPRCELALPPRAELRPWHVTLVHLGGATLCVRGSRKGRLRLEGVEVDQAVLRDGDALDLGTVRVVYRCR